MEFTTSSQISQRTGQSIHEEDSLGSGTWSDGLPTLENNPASLERDSGQPQSLYNTKTPPAPYLNAPKLRKGPLYTKGTTTSKLMRNRLHDSILGGGGKVRVKIRFLAKP